MKTGSGSLNVPPSKGALRSLIRASGLTPDEFISLSRSRVLADLISCAWLLSPSGRTSAQHSGCARRSYPAKGPPRGTILAMSELNVLVSSRFRAREPGVGHPDRFGQARI